LDEEPKNKPKLWTETNHIPVPSFPLATLTRIEHEYTKVSQHREGLLIENSAKGAAILAMRLLRGLSSSSVVVLAGNNKNGAVGLAMARMMVDRGYQVTVCLASPNKDHLCRLVAFEYHTLYNLGVPIVYHPSDIKDDCNLVVDAILGPENKLMDNLSAFHAITEAISWAKCQNKPILSIDFPSGIDADTGTCTEKKYIFLIKKKKKGAPQHPEYVIYPQWTISLGIPKLGCNSLRITGALCLVEIGIPHDLYKKEGIDVRNIFSKTDVLINLTYDKPS
jgi:NAD(P)H-hydrate repair Nnr-like enzyme with NAD(P)H-hydrate epimerase domain